MGGRLATIQAGTGADIREAVGVVETGLGNTIRVNEKAFGEIGAMPAALGNASVSVASSVAGVVCGGAEIPVLNAIDASRCALSNAAMTIIASMNEGGG